MNRTKRINMLIPLDGISEGKRTTSITPEGFHGEECVNATADLEAKLGMAAAERELTQEYYEQPEPQRERHNQGGGAGNSSQ